MQPVTDSILRSLFKAAIDSVHGEHVTRNALALYAGDTQLGVLALGKSAPAMMAGALPVLGDRVVAGLMVCKRGNVDPDRYSQYPIEIVEAAHPVPDADSFVAGERVLKFFDSLPPQAEVIVLISGGASSLAEVLPEGVTQEDLARLNRYFLESGADIRRAVSVRSAVSRLKGGRLLNRLGERKVEVWLLSDVPDDDPALIGSGPFWPEQLPLPVDLPGWVCDLIARVEPAPNSHDRTVPEHHIIATQDDARDAIGIGARRERMFFQDHGRALDGGITAAASQLIATIRDSLASANECSRPTVHVWSGESTIVLPENAGQGGRNQHLALLVAKGLDGIGGWSALIAGSDGDDAETGAAGAIVDGQLGAEAAASGHDIDAAIARADSHPLLDACGALLVTGPTGTNVADLAIAITGCRVDLDRP